MQYSTACGTSPFECVTVSPAPEIITNIDGPTSTCALAKDLVYTIPKVFGANDYLWTVPTRASIVSGQGTNTIHVNFGTHAGIVTVQALNFCGTSPSKFINVAIAGCFQDGSRSLAFSKSSDVYIKIFPNPSEGIIHMSIPASRMSQSKLIYITDPLGRIVYRNTFTAVEQTTYTLDLHSLSKGMYILNLQDDTGLYSAKIIMR